MARKIDPREFLYNQAADEVLDKCANKTGRQLVRGGWEVYLSAILTKPFVSQDRKQRASELLDLAENFRSPRRIF